MIGYEKTCLFALKIKIDLLVLIFAIVKLMHINFDATKQLTDNSVCNYSAEAHFKIGIFC